MFSSAAKADAQTFHTIGHVAEMPHETSTSPEQEQGWKLNFHGVEKEFFRFSVIDLLWTVLTLGIFSFWAKTHQRRYVYSQTEMAGDRFVYHGTGRELFFGFLKALLITCSPFILMFTIYCLSLPEPFLILAFLPMPFISLIGLAASTVGRRRYRLSRTSLRGIRFSFRGSMLHFLELYFGSYSLIFMTLGSLFTFLSRQ